MTILDNFLKPRPLAYYKNMVSPKPENVTLQVQQEEKAVVLKVYDRGVDALTKEEVLILNRVFLNLKNAIHP